MNWNIKEDKVYLYKITLSNEDSFRTICTDSYLVNQIMNCEQGYEKVISVYDTENRRHIFNPNYIVHIECIEDIKDETE